MLEPWNHGTSVRKKDHAQSLCVQNIAKPHSTGSPKVCEQRWNKHFSWWQTRNQLLRSNPAEKHANDRTSLQPAPAVKGGPVIDPKQNRAVKRLVGSSWSVQRLIHLALVTPRVKNVNICNHADLAFHFWI